MAEPLRVSEVISAALYGDGERREVPEVARLASLLCGDPIARKPEAKPDACCAPVEQEACCEPSAKADCCGTAASGSGCGCH